MAIVVGRIKRGKVAVVGLHLLLAAVHVLTIMVIFVMVILMITLLVAQITAFLVEISDNNIVP